MPTWQSEFERLSNAEQLALAAIVNGDLRAGTKLQNVIRERVRLRKKFAAVGQPAMDHEIPANEAQ